ncbi:hypothetical protein CBOM_07683 [Ceraceosorus bombacis]|uniref:Uncharacterized protein n=1 Tax=Ceraceosorus bombacis TaxID=401625 RepID=A0A0P1BM49_9BASI|nr:hypothetical protein CBOM_07683 [Ceraceosorus bombacis]
MLRWRKAFRTSQNMTTITLERTVGRVWGRRILASSAIALALAFARCERGSTSRLKTIIRLRPSDQHAFYVRSGVAGAADYVPVPRWLASPIAFRS